MKRILILFFFCGFITSVFAQEAETSKRHSFLAFVHGSYGILPNKTAGLTSSSSDYAKELSASGAWNMQAYWQHRMLIVGLMYSGYAASGELEQSSDNILTTYIAPQIGMIIPFGESGFGMVFNGGFGGMWLRNNGFQYDNSCKVTGSTFGINLGLKFTYDFTKNLGISLEALAVNANLSSFKKDYLNETTKTNQPVPLNQLSFSLGLKYSL